MSNKKQYDNINRLSTIELKDTRGKSFTMYLRDLYYALLPYKVMMGQLQQYQTDAPIQITHVNNTGLTIQWTRENSGIYHGVFLNESGDQVTLNIEKTEFLLGGQTSQLGFTMANVAWSGTEIEIYTYDETQTPADEALYYTTFELRIFQ